MKTETTEVRASRRTLARGTGLGSPGRALLRLSLYGLFTVLLIPLQAAAIALNHRLRVSLPVWYHRRCCRLLDIRVVRRGRRSDSHPTLYVSNHTSYLDIMALGSLIRGSFVAKAEVATWPLFGLLARLQGSVFVERRARGLGQERDELAKRLRAGDDLILFPEGTSNDGNRVLPFKSALFAVVERDFDGHELMIQPVSITYTKLDGLPLGRALRPFYAWYGDMVLAPHIWHLAGMGQLTVVVQFHPPVSAGEFSSRKALSRHCFAAVSQGVSAALSGRLAGGRA